MRILVAVVLNWPKIQVMHVLKQNQPNKKGKKKRQEQTNKKVTKNPSDTVSRLKDNVDQWPFSETVTQCASILLLHCWLERPALW